MSTEAAGQDFVLTIQDVFSIAGRGTVVVGQIESGVLRPGETVGVWSGDHLLATAPAWIDLVCGRREGPKLTSLLLGGLGEDVLNVGHTVRRSATPPPN